MRDVERFVIFQTTESERSRVIHLSNMQQLYSRFMDISTILFRFYSHRKYSIHQSEILIRIGINLHHKMWINQYDLSSDREMLDANTKKGGKKEKIEK